MRPFRADVVRLDHAVTRHFALDGQVPLLVLRIVVLGRGSARAASEERTRVAPRGEGQAYRERIVDGGVLRTPAIQRPRNAGVGEAESRSYLAFDRVA